MNPTNDTSEFQSTNYNDSDLEGLIHNEWGTPAENDSLTDTLDEPVLDTLMRDLRVEPMKIDFRIETSVLQQFDSKKFFKIPRAKIKVIHSEYQMGRILEILHFWTILDFAHV